MNHVIYKYRIAVTNESGVDVPLTPDSQILRARLCGDRVIEFWLEHSPSAVIGHTHVIVVGTGHPFADDYRAVATVFDDPFVWHLITRDVFA